MMREYLEIKSRPLIRDNEKMCVPAGLLAARLRDTSETIELRYVKGKERLKCLIGIDNDIRRTQLEIILRELRCGFSVCKAPNKQLTNTILIRDIELTQTIIQERISSSGGDFNNIPYLEKELIIPEIVSNSNRLEQLFFCLSQLDENSGFSVFIKLADDLPKKVRSKLKKNINYKDDIFDRLFNEPKKYKGCLCIYANTDEQRKLLTDELLYAFSGTSVYEFSESFDPEMVWDRVGQIKFKETELINTYLLSEVEFFCNMDGIPLASGIDVNKDSLFQKQRNSLTVDCKKIVIGKNENGEEQSIPVKRLCQHMFISGAPGFGKGNLIFFIAEQLYKLKIPTLLIESAKQEQHHLKKSMPELRVWRPRGGEYLLNPFSLPPDVTMGDYRPALLQMLRTCFKGGGEESALDELYATTLNRCLSKYGYSEKSNERSVGVTPFGLSEFIMEYIQVLENNGYSDKLRDDMRTAGVTRLRALFDQNPDVFDTVRSVPVTELIKGFNLIQLNSLTTVESKQLFATILLISLSSWLRVMGRESKDLQLVIIMDESHNLLKGVKNSSNVVYSFAEDFENLLLEMRALGVGFIIADQSAKNLPRIISDVCATKVFLGSSQFSGIDMYLDTLGADEYTLKNLYLLKAGEGIWNTYGMSSGAFFSSPNVIDSYDISETYEFYNAYTDCNKSFFCQTYNECNICPTKGSCKIEDKQKARAVSDILISIYRSQLEMEVLNLMKATVSNEDDSENTSKKDKTGKLNSSIEKFSTTYLRIARDIVKMTNNGNPFCCAIQFIRKYNREVRKPLNDMYIKKLLLFVKQVVDEEC